MRPIVLPEEITRKIGERCAALVLSQGGGNEFASGFCDERAVWFCASASADSGHNQPMSLVHADQPGAYAFETPAEAQRQALFSGEASQPNDSTEPLYQAPASG